MVGWLQETLAAASVLVFVACAFILAVAGEALLTPDVLLRWESESLAGEGAHLSCGRFVQSHATGVRLCKGWPIVSAENRW
jgi:hypothetical protein